MYPISYISSQRCREQWSRTKYLTFDNIEYHFNYFRCQFSVQKMKFFLLTQKYFTLLGISSSQSKRKYPFLNRKILKAYSCYSIAIILFSVSFFGETHTFGEYAELIFRSLLPILLVIAFSIVVFKMEILFKIIDSCEEIVDKSKWIKLFSLDFNLSSLETFPRNQIIEYRKLLISKQINKSKHLPKLFISSLHTWCRQFLFGQKVGLAFIIVLTVNQMGTTPSSWHIQCGNFRSHFSFSLCLRFCCEPISDWMKSTVSRLIIDYSYPLISKSFRWRFPFDTNSPFGYVIAIILQYIYASYSFIFGGCILSFAVGAFLFALTMVNDIKCCLESVDESVKTKDHQLILMRYVNFLQYFSDAKQLSKLKKNELEIFEVQLLTVFPFRAIQYFMELFQPILISLFTFGLISICCTVLIIQIDLVQYSFLEHSNSNFLLILRQLIVFLPFNFSPSPK